MAQQIGYTLNPSKRDVREKRLYQREELEHMTTHQLREICQREQIMRSILNPLDKEELIHVISRYCGLTEEYLITEHLPEGIARVSEMLGHANIQINSEYRLDGHATIIVYEGAATAYYDQITMRYDSCFVGTNALVVSDDRTVCGIFNVVSRGRDRERLYLVQDHKIACTEVSDIKNYSLYCFNQETSKQIKALYMGEADRAPKHLMVYKLPILDFCVRGSRPLELPLAIDFGTTNTVVGAYLDSTYFENISERPGTRGLLQDAINYALYYDTTTEECRECEILPSVVAVRTLEGGNPQYAFGYDALRLASTIYTDESFTVFYDMKRWVTDYEKSEELTDRQGRYAVVSRKEIIKAYFEYIITQARNRFKCTVSSIHISAPVKQKYLFREMFADILPQYIVDMEGFLDEGMTVLYSTITERIAKKDYENDVSQRALIIDCGGGTTDLCSCVYTITDNRVSYGISLETTYENGDTNFGGNNLTYRIMQLIKLELAAKLGADICPEQIIQGLDIYISRCGRTWGFGSLFRASGRL